MNREIKVLLQITSPPIILKPAKGYINLNAGMHSLHFLFVLNVQ